MDVRPLTPAHMPFTSVIRFHVKPREDASFEAAFEAAGMLTRPDAINGFLGAKLLRSETEPLEYLVIGEWQTREAYGDWQAVSSRTADAEALARLLETLVDPKPGRLFACVMTSEDS